MKTILAILLLIILANCKERDPKISKSSNYYNVDPIYNDYLVGYADNNEFVYGSSCGYKTIMGHVVIPKGKYMHCFTDTFRTFAYVSDPMLTKGKIVAISRSEKILFEAYMFDNGPDWLKEGLFRIIRNGKIGYANSTGEVVIEPKYKCAGQFENGIAKVAFDCKEVKDEHDSEHSKAESSSWFFIDNKGNKVK